MAANSVVGTFINPIVINDWSPAVYLRSPVKSWKEISTCSRIKPYCVCVAIARVLTVNMYPHIIEAL